MTNAREQSFQRFCSAPENLRILKEEQHREFRSLQKMSSKNSAIFLRDSVLRLNMDAQRDIAPFLESKILRSILKTFTNESDVDFGVWVQNENIIDMLTRAKKMFDENSISEDEAERIVLETLKHAPKSTHSTTTLESSMKLEPSCLVHALNEHIQVRIQGNRLYDEKKFALARLKYIEALSIVSGLAGSAIADQDEINKHHGFCLMNLGAACMAENDFGEAVVHLNRAQKYTKNNAKLFMRRAHAHAKRGNFEDAFTDLSRARKLPECSAEVEEMIKNVNKMKRMALKQEKEIAGNAFFA